VNVGPRVHTNVFIYPHVPASATCLANGEFGDRISIALLDWDNGLHKHKQGVSIGIPGNEADRDERFAETYIPAHKSFTLNIGGGGSIGGMGMVRGGCSGTASWIPDAGTDYEAVYDWNVCRLQVYTIEPDKQEGKPIKRLANAKSLQLCGKSAKVAK